MNCRKRERQCVWERDVEWETQDSVRKSEWEREREREREREGSLGANNLGEESESDEEWEKEREFFG